MSAGARLTVIRRAGSARPEAIRAERPRSRASDTALSGTATIANAGRPGATCTCTSTARASIPSKATVDTRATMPSLVTQSKVAGNRRVSQEHLKNIDANNPLCAVCLSDRHNLGAWIHSDGQPSSSALRSHVWAALGNMLQRRIVGENARRLRRLGAWMGWGVAQAPYGQPNDEHSRADRDHVFGHLPGLQTGC